MTPDLAGALTRRTISLSLEVLGRDRGAIFGLARWLEADDERSATAFVGRAVAAAEVGLQEVRAGAMGDALDASLRSVRLGAFARALLDLWRAGWSISVDDGVYAAPPKLADVRDVEELCAAKEAVRGAMRARVREQVEETTTARLVAEVEPKIRALIADPTRLRADLSSRGADAIQPYLQVARRADGDDVTTGLPLYSVFRYLRFWWSFPFGSTPGRSLPILIRDAGQPGHPVCGLLCFASPVLRLTDRDDALGLTAAWLEAFVAALDIDAADRGVALPAWLEALRAQGRNAISPDGLSRDLARTVGVDGSGGARHVMKRLLRLSAAQWDAARFEAARRVARDLVSDLASAIGLISFDDLGVTMNQALAAPREHGDRLGSEGKDAKAAWEDSRRIAGVARTDAGKDLLFHKKRAAQASKLLLAWADIAAVRESLGGPPEAPLLALRSSTSRRAASYVNERLESGAWVSRGASEAVIARKVALASSRVADVSLCGAIPPYDKILGGKLVALLALSRDAASLYHQAYDGVASDIQSRMAGVEVRRSADLVAVTTTSLYGVGSSQYNRVALPPALGGQRWAEVGRTAGHGTMHFSDVTVNLAYAAYVHSKAEGADLITGRFGEGPSERMRKLREGLTSLRLPADDLLKHGMERISYVCAFCPVHPGAGAADLSPPDLAPADLISAWWRERWAAPRTSAAIERLAEFKAEDVLLSHRFPSEVAKARGSLYAASGAGSRQLNLGDALPSDGDDDGDPPD